MVQPRKPRHGFIDIMKDQCLRQIRKLGVAIVDMVADEIKRSKILKANYPVQQIREIVKALALDNDVVEVKSTGIGEFASIQPGKFCYKCVRHQDASREPSKKVAMASVPWVSFLLQLVIIIPSGWIFEVFCFLSPRTLISSVYWHIHSCT
ncbi:hypothetical protein MLD38_040678 [Melastoma candidum]|nr:hypothetical protein MLD38_040678 [Melastoma candidum]